MFDENKLIAFVDGMVTDEADLTDEMYTSVPINEKRCLADDFRRQHHPGIPKKHGYAGDLIKRAISDAKAQGRKGTGADLKG